MNARPLFKKITQIGLVVRNAEETAKRCWEQFGLGPWTFYIFEPSRVKEMIIRGQRVDHAMRTAHATIGDIDWEIIEPLDNKSIYAEHLRTHGEGLHHILFAVDSYTDAKAQLEDSGHPELASGKWAGNPYAYFDTQKSLACIAELWSPLAASKDISPADGSYP
jgi:methylmalonyl-CoA/ethylmalonyl-CoA epimerase